MLTVKTGRMMPHQNPLYPLILNNALELREVVVVPLECEEVGALRITEAVSLNMVPEAFFPGCAAYKSNLSGGWRANWCLCYLLFFFLSLSGRGRENKENERNLEDSRGAGGGSSAPDRDQRESFRRGGGGNRGGRMSNGAGRGGGRGGSRTGPRSFSNRGNDRAGAPFPRATSWNPDEDGADSKSSKRLVFCDKMKSLCISAIFICCVFTFR